MSTSQPNERTILPATTGERHPSRCPECAGELRTLELETFCIDCGLVVAEDRLDRGPEWRPFVTDSETRRRVGSPLRPDRHDRGLSTTIGFESASTPARHRSLHRLRREHNRAKFASKAERNLAIAFTEIARMSSALELPRSTRERAAVIYREAQHGGLLIGRSIEMIAAGSVYAACRCFGQTRSIAELASVARCSTDHVELGYRLLNRELGLAVPPSRAGQYLPKLAAAVDARSSVRERAAELISLAEADDLATGVHPGGLAAACLYRAGHEAGQLYTQAELAAVVDVTATTIRSRLVELRSL